MKYEVTYLTVNGRYCLPSRTLEEAQTDKARLEVLAKTKGYGAWGIKIRKIEA